MSSSVVFSLAALAAKAAALQGGLPQTEELVTRPTRMLPSMNYAVSSPGIGIHLDRKGENWSFSGGAAYEKGGLAAPGRSLDRHNNSFRGNLSGNVRTSAGKFSAKVSAARHEVPNRQNLGDDFWLVGQGYGFLGLKGPDWGVNTGGDGQALYEDVQRAELKWSTEVRGLALSATLDYERLGLSNRSQKPVLDRFMLSDPRFDPNFDSSQEFNPDGSAENKKITLNAKWSMGGIGVNLNAQHAYEQERLRITPGSQLALNYMAANLPGFVGPGQFLFEDDFMFFPLLDDLGNQVYALDSNTWVDSQRTSRHWTQASISLFPENTIEYKGFKFPIALSAKYIKNDGKENSGFLPDIAIERDGVSLRWKRDLMRHRSGFGEMFGYVPGASRIDTTTLAYNKHGFSAWVSKSRIGSYLEWQPALPGSLLGIYVPLVTDRADQYQAGVSTFQTESWGDWGMEYIHGVTRLSGFNSTGLPASPYAAADELHRLSARARYRVGSGYLLGVLTFGSGTQNSDLLQTGNRVAFTQLDLGYQTNDFTILLQNVFDQRSLRTFNTYPGITFTPPRRLLVAWNRKL